MLGHEMSARGVIFRQCSRSVGFGTEAGLEPRSQNLSAPAHREVTRP
jgi:hypothetical protein